MKIVRRPATVRERLAAIFFAPSDAKSLSLFRFLYCLSLAATIAWEPAYRRTHAGLLHHAYTFRPIRLFGLLGIDFISPGMFSFLRAATLAALTLAAFGLLTRWALTAAWIAFFLYYGTIHSAWRPPVGDALGLRTNPVIFILWILSVSPGIGYFGLDRWSRGRVEGQPGVVPAWPTLAVKLMLGLIYFGAGYCKLTHAQGWADGHALQGFLLGKAMQADAGLGFWLAHHRWLCAALSGACVILESSFFLVVLFPRLAWIYVIGGLTMHAMIWVTMRMNYFMFFGYAYWVFLRWPWAPRGAGSTPPQQRSRSAAAFIIGLASINLFCTLAHFSAWPFSPWNFYCQPTTYAQVKVARLQGILGHREKRWLTEPELQGQAVDVSNKFTEALSIRDYRWIQDSMRALVADLPKDEPRELKAISLVERTVRRSPDGTFQFVDTPILKIPIPDRPLDK
ncbi:MAG: hypothetical protein HY077_07760 [Elusimicrobia bacterium]|nr:hypothetical protein [Elusimicrobiota bacterium]